MKIQLVFCKTIDIPTMWYINSVVLFYDSCKHQINYSNKCYKWYMVQQHEPKFQYIPKLLHAGVLNTLF